MSIFLIALTNPLMFIGYHFVLFCFTFFSSLFVTNYLNFVKSKKLVFLTIRGILGCLWVSLILQFKGLCANSLDDMFLVIDFRNDLFSQSLIFISTGLFLYFFTIMLNILSHTKLPFKYLLEIPNILLLLLVCVQLFLLANDLIVFILTLELITFIVLILLNISFFTERPSQLSLESAVKYFVFNGFSMGLLWLSVVGYFAIFKKLNLAGITIYFTLFPEITYIYGNTLIALHFIFFFAYLIKLGSGPVHFWLPDVYEGAETFITSLLVILIAPILFIKFIMLLTIITTNQSEHLTQILLVTIGTISVIVGTFSAFSQKKIKRFLAFAGLTHFGFMFICLNQLTIISFVGVVIYLIFYILMNIIFFSILLLMQRHTSTALIYFTQLRGLFIGNDLLLYLGLVTILSFAGLPPFAGFFSKAIVLYIIVSTNNFGILCFLLCAILVNVYLYLRLIKISLFETFETTRFLTSTSPISSSSFFIRLVPSHLNTAWTLPNQQLVGFLTILTIFLFSIILYLPTLIVLSTKAVELLILSY